MASPRTSLGHTHPKRSPTYLSWSSMKQRCSSLTSYAGRLGVAVCARWLGPDGFVNFLADMGERPEGKTLDRYPKREGDYEPGNVRWATDEEQAQNQTTTIATDSMVLEIRGRFEHGERVASIARRLEVKPHMVGKIVRNERWKEAA